MTIPIAWRPDQEVLKRARLTAFLSQCGEPDYASLHRRSIDDIEWYTEEMLRFLQVAFDPPYTKLLDTSEGIEWPRWCVGGGLNISSACLDGKEPRQPAISWEGEEGGTRSWSYKALQMAVRKCAAGLRDIGVQKGDRVAVHLPMMPETAAVLLALARIGAVAIPLFTGYGHAAIEERVRDVGATVIFTANAFPRRGKSIASKTVVDQVAASYPELRHVVVVPRLDNFEAPMTAGRDLTWDELCSRGTDDSVCPTSTEDPLIIIYSSGTTGRPKGMVHLHGTFPIKGASDMAFGFDVGKNTRICWVTDIGWVMGPWLFYGALMLGGTVVLYDGAPDFPHPARLWAFADRHGVDVLGLSPTLIRALQPHGDEIARRYDLSKLKLFGSTGEPWNTEPWQWLFEVIGKSRVPIINYSGGTEISGGILLNNPLLEMKPCGFSAACLGIAADVVDEHGNSIREGVGELVVRKPWLGMTHGFHNDRERYHDTYWSMFPGTWRHGDFAEIDADGHWFIHGRSDDTIKVAGKRIGPAEIESVLVSHSAVVEAAVIAIPDERTGNAIAAFVVRNGEVEADALKDLVAGELGRPLRPSVVAFVTAIPKTRNGKLMRRLVRAAWLDQPTGDLTAVDNLQALEEIRSVRKTFQ
ncbi:MAG: AMP-binding protein [Acidobacteria bacterium]|nr:AMP-binding protein [Acidobacteriota bacterium]